ncbi:alpha/beta hydrolase [Amycolatopsis suaedae]|uniref:Alpha/beta hydrolase n=1 Tax=Amycolatopsis suaedae TaxID=2510978 RepID=A0A4V2ELN5_9PSEU|nr:alpha/beta hydrolase [Amycolatopsis suaedae]
MWVGSVLAVVVLVVGLAYAFQRKLIYLPSTAPVPSAASMLAGARDVVLHTADGLELGAWFLPARTTPERGAVLVAPGNAGDRTFRAPLAAELAARGFAVLLVDYRGYGGNPGSPTEEGLTQDIRAAHRFLAGAGYGPDRLRYYGESLGCSLVTKLATEQPPAALVLRSPFTDLPAVGQRQYPILPVRLLMWDRFPVAEDVRRIRVPVTVVLGTEDSLVPPEQSRAVAAAAAGPSRVVEVAGAGHNDPALLTGDALLDAITA